MNSKSLKVLTIVVILPFIAMLLHGCSLSGEDAGTEYEFSNIDFHMEQDNKQVSDPTLKTMRLGSSLYAVQVDKEYKTIRVTNDFWEDDMMARYVNTNTSLDLSVYQFSKEGYPKRLRAFIKQEAKEYDATEVVTNLKVNGIHVGYYRSTEENNGEIIDGITFVIDVGKEYLELDFRYADTSSEEEAWEIVNSIRHIDIEKMTIGNYSIGIPNDYTMVSNENSNPIKYESGNSSICLYIYYTPTIDKTLVSFVNENEGSDIEIDQMINDIPIASYRSIETHDGSYHSMLNYVIEDDSNENIKGFYTLSFRLDGITAEKEAEAIIESLSKDN